VDLTRCFSEGRRGVRSDRKRKLSKNVEGGERKRIGAKRTQIERRKGRYFEEAVRESKKPVNKKERSAPQKTKKIKQNKNP
jgi:hypothetical protein